LRPKGAMFRKARALARSVYAVLYAVESALLILINMPLLYHFREI
jgi:hypothetical protein